MEKKWILFLLLVVMTACKSTSTTGVFQEIGLGEFIVIDPKDVDKERCMASNFVDSIVYIPLETRNDILIGKIKTIREWNNRFYVWDGQSDVIFIFDMQGKFLKKIASKGRGPKEYMEIGAFYQNPRNGDIYIRCDRSFSILRFDSEGVFVERIPCEFIVTDFTLIGKDSLVLYGGKMPNQEVFRETYPDQYRLVVMQNGNIIKKELPSCFNETLLRDVGRSFYFSYFSDTTSLLETIGNNIYRLNENGSLVLRFTLNFGEYTYPLSFQTKPDEAMEIIQTQRKSSKWCKIIDIIETDEHLLISYSFQKYIFQTLYSKLSQKVYNIGVVWLNDIDRVPMASLYASGNGCFLGSLEAHVLLNSVKNTDKVSEYVEEIAQGLTEMDNPLIVRIKMKKI